jgi:phage host-nuclease inhibitor protein Gam
MTDTLDHLEAQLRPTDAPDQPTEGWSITGLETADWASEKAAAARREIARYKAWGEAKKARIDAIVAAETKRFEEDAAFFEGHLAVYLQAEIAAGRKTKSLELSGGTIKLTARQPKVEWDEFQAVIWAKEAGRAEEFVRVKESLDKNAIKKAAVLAEDGVVVVDGEIIPGAQWIEQEDSASFSVKEEAAS